jgi:alcohol dehydrogenase
VNQPGVFEEFFVLPERNLHVLPEGMPAERAVFTEPVAAACEILEQVAIPAGEPVAVLGDGKLGLLVALVLNAHGCRVHQFGRHAEKLRIAEAAGVDIECNAAHLPTGAYGWVVEATGNPEGLRAAVAMARPRGTVVMKSTVHGTVAIDTAPAIVNELTLVGSRCGRFEAALPLLVGEAIPFERMISDRFKLRDAAKAFTRAAERGVLKVLLDGVA